MIDITVGILGVALTGTLLYRAHLHDKKIHSRDNYLGVVTENPEERKKRNLFLIGAGISFLSSMVAPHL